MKPRICAYVKGSTNPDSMKSELPTPCKSIGCNAKFAKMPPLYEGLILSCFMDAETLETGEEIAIRMKDTRGFTDATTLFKMRDEK